MTRCLNKCHHERQIIQKSLGEKGQETKGSIQDSQSQLRSHVPETREP